MSPSDEQQSLDVPYGKGETVKVKGVRGTFRVTGKNKDGSIGVYGGPSSRERFRSFPESQIVPVKKRGKR